MMATSAWEKRTVGGGWGVASGCKGLSCCILEKEEEDFLKHIYHQTQFIPSW